MDSSMEASTAPLYQKPQQTVQPPPVQTQDPRYAPQPTGPEPPGPVPPVAPTATHTQLPPQAVPAVQQPQNPVAMLPLQQHHQPVLPHYTPQQPSMAGAQGSGGVVYYAQPQPGMGQVTIMPRAPGLQQPNYTYTPNNYLWLSLLTCIACGFFSPVSLLCSIPAFAFSLRSEATLKNGDIKGARKLGLMAVYLSIAAILFALIVAAIFTGVFVAYGNYGFRFCTRSYYSYGSYYC